MVSKIHNKSTMSPKKLSKLLKERGAREFTFIKTYKEWVFLLGGLITCPLCGEGAVIVPYGISLPIRKNFNIPCHCSISLSSGKIYYHLCIEDNGKNNQRYFSTFSTSNLRGPGIRLREHKDVCKLFTIIMRNGYRV